MQSEFFQPLKKKHYSSNSRRVPEVTYIRLYFPHAAKIPAPPLKRNGRGSRGLFAAFPAPSRLLFFMSHFLQPPLCSTLHPQAECNKLRHPSKQKNQAASNHHHQLPLRHKKTTQSHINIMNIIRAPTVKAVYFIDLWASYNVALC